eukprot:PhF_6_TR10993/c0_g1_i1/m.17791
MDEAEYVARVKAEKLRVAKGIQGITPFVVWDSWDSYSQSTSSYSLIPRRKLMPSLRPASSQSVHKKKLHEALEKSTRPAIVKDMTEHRDSVWEDLLFSLQYTFSQDPNESLGGTVWFHSSMNESVRAYMVRSGNVDLTTSAANDVEYFSRANRFSEEKLKIIPKDDDLETKTIQLRLRNGFLIGPNVDANVTFDACIVFDSDKYVMHGTTHVAIKRMMCFGKLKPVPKDVRVIYEAIRSQHAAGGKSRLSLPTNLTTLNSADEWRQRLHERMRRCLLRTHNPLRNIDASGAPCSDSGDIPNYIPYKGSTFELHCAAWVATVCPNSKSVPPVGLMEITRRFPTLIRDIPKQLGKDPHVLNVKVFSRDEIRIQPLEIALSCQASGLLAVDVEGPAGVGGYRHSVLFSKR